MSGTELTLEQKLAAPRSAIWAAWADPLLLEKWFCPRPWRTEVIEYDFVPGGAFSTVLRGPDGEEHAASGCFLELIEASRLVWTSALAGGWRPVHSDLSFTAIIDLADSGVGTAYSVRAVHIDSEACARHAAMGFAEGWGATIAQLDDLAQTIANGG